MVRFFFILILSFFVIQGQSQYTYDFNNNCREAYSSIISLKFEEGKSLINQEKERNPKNNIPYLLDNYIYFLSVFISEEEELFEEYENYKDDIIDRLKDGDKNSPYYRYSLAQVYLQWAVARTKFKEYVTATFEINKAYRNLEENADEFPDFLPNLINLGLLHTMIGTIPDNYNWVKKMVGIEGTIDQGVAEILKVLDVSIKQEEFSHYKAECLFYLSFIQVNLTTNKQKAIDYINIIEKDSSNMQNPLAIYAISRIYADNAYNDKAIDILLSRPKGSEYYPFHFLDYLTGLAKLHRLDDDAHAYFFKYLSKFKGTNYIKDSYQKIAWHYLVQHKTDKYKEYIQKVENYGSDVVDADKQAEREAESGVVPNIYLLRSRLLFDGGYYEKAINELLNNDKDLIVKTPRESLEYNYRLGRIYHEWGKTDKSISYYKKTIEMGSESEYYYAANSALKLGMIYEIMSNYKEAEFYYKEAQSMENEEYRNSINQKAKAGLQRIENKS